METDVPSSGDEDDAFHEAEVGNPEARDLPLIVGGASLTAEDAATSPPPNEVKAAHSRRWVIGVIAAVVAIIGVVVAIILLSSTSAGISMGSGTATITWTPVTGANPDTVGNPPQPFTGTIDGISLAGIATTPLTSTKAKSLGSAQLSENIFRWKGTFGGKPFNVGIYVNYQPATATTNPASSSLTVSGKWGNERVIGKVATPSAAELKRGNAPLHFTGTVGDLKVSGMVPPPLGGSGNPSSTATFTVSR